MSHEASFKSALEESFNNNTRMDFLTRGRSDTELFTTPKKNEVFSVKKYFEDKEDTPKAEYKIKHAEEIKQILDDKLEAVVELINESINNNNKMGNNLIEFRKNQAMMSPRYF